MPTRPARKSKKIQKQRKKGFSWRGLVKSRKTKDKIRRAFSLAVLIIVSVVFLSGLGFYKVLTKQFASADSNSAFDIENSEIVTLSIISVDSLKNDNINTKGISLVFFDKEKNKVVSFDVPLDLEVDAPGKFGDEKLEKMFQLGMIESGDPEDGAKYLNQALESIFAFNVDRYIVIDDDYATSISDAYIFGRSRGLMNYENLSGLFTSMKTNAGLNELYSLYTFVNSLPSDRFIHHENSADFYKDSSYTDTILRDMTFDSKVAVEKASVAVLNGTNIPGVASFGSRVILNSGGYVFSVENTKETYHESIIIVSSMDLAVVKEIQRFFDIEMVVEKRLSDNLESIADRADVTVIIGFDKANSL